MINTSLQVVSVFKGLTESQIEVVKSYLTVIDVPEGTKIIQENTVEDNMYVLFEGKVRITKKLVLQVGDIQSEDKVLATLDGDELPAFGENGLLGCGSRTATVIAVTQCKLWVLTKESYRELLSIDIEAGFVIMQNIACIQSQRLASTDQQVVKLATALALAVRR